MTSLRDFVLAARARMVAAGIDASEAALDASGLARHVLGWDLARWISHETDPPSPGFAQSFDALVARRERREPMSAIAGHREFWGLEFDVTPAVLAPRPETEIIIESALAVAGTALAPARGVSAPAAIVDVGTGSGCLAVALALEFPSARVIATDVSTAALGVATSNAERHGVAGRISFRHASLLEGVDTRASLIVSNPPYVPTGDIAGLPPEVRDWEPHEALDGGVDGLDVVRALLGQAPGVLLPGGWLVMEFGFGQDQGIRDLVAGSALELVEIRSDLQQIPRTLVARKPETGR
jgi:release factor glutamine methyltransferase